MNIGVWIAKALRSLARVEIHDPDELRMALADNRNVVPAAPHFSCLRAFGGSLTIEEFRNQHCRQLIFAWPAAGQLKDITIESVPWALLQHSCDSRVHNSKVHQVIVDYMKEVANTKLKLYQPPVIVRPAPPAPRAAPLQPAPVVMRATVAATKRRRIIIEDDQTPVDVPAAIAVESEEHDNSPFVFKPNGKQRRAANVRRTEKLLKSHKAGVTSEVFKQKIGARYSSSDGIAKVLGLKFNS
jgi:hypothetical protein